MEKKIQDGVFEHRIKEIGTPGRNYITRYRLDLDVKTTAVEIRIYADENGKYQVLDEYKAEVSYGETICSMAAFLYSEEVMANDRICEFINSISGDTLRLCEGSVYGFCRKFAKNCERVCTGIEESLLNTYEICTDATTIKTDGKQTYIRNFSTETSVLYVGSEKKDLESLEGMRIVKGFTGTLTHDHETALYHFGTGHGECNVHLECYSRRYDEILEAGREQNRKTKGRNAKKRKRDFQTDLKNTRKIICCS